jgi:hypothetical protein
MDETNGHSVEVTSSMELRHMKFFLIAILMGAMSAVAYAQKMERPKDLEVGDKVTFKWVRNNKPFTLEQEVTAVTDTQVQAIERFGGNETELVWTKSPLLVKNGLCMSNALPCTYDPGVEVVQFPLEKGKKWPLEKGKKWPSKFTVKGPDFVAQVESERTVEGIERIKVTAANLKPIGSASAAGIAEQITKDLGSTAKTKARSGTH